VQEARWIVRTRVEQAALDLHRAHQPRPPSYRYALPEMPLGFVLLCTFARPSSPLLHKLLWLIGHASSLLACATPSTSATKAGNGTDAAASAMGIAASPVAEGGVREAIYRAVTLGTQLVQLLLVREQGLGEKAARVRREQERVQRWAYWDANPFEPCRAELVRLQAELWRKLPPARSGGSPLVHALHEELVMGDACTPARRSALAGAVIVLRAVASERPSLASRPLALATLCVLRHMRGVLRGRFATLLRAECITGDAMHALLDLVSDADEDDRWASLGANSDEEAWDEDGGGTANVMQLPMPALAVPAAAGAPLDSAAARRSTCCQAALLLLDDLAADAHSAPTAFELLGLTPAHSSAVSARLPGDGQPRSDDELLRTLLAQAALLRTTLQRGAVRNPHTRTSAKCSHLPRPATRALRCFACRAVRRDHL